MPSAGTYAVTERLRLGSHTELCRAVRAFDSRSVLLNVLHRTAPFPAQRSRFEHDFETSRSLALPCVVEPYVMEERDAGVTIVLEDFGGDPLDLLLARGGIGLPEAIAIALRAAEALGDIHGRGITHKDIRPANLIFSAETGQLKITGFGVATALKREAPSNRTARLPETDLAYMSPEQTGRMNRSLDYRTDFYSLGVTVYRCLTGRLPFAAEDELELVHSHLAREPVAPASIDPSIPAAVSRIVMKLLAKPPEERYQSAFGLATDLRECRDQLDRTAEVQDFELGRHDRSESFRIPEKLYGRERQVDLLLQALDRTGQGKAEMVLVAGYSGVGKSALINELHRPIVRQRGYFISGKYDQYKRHIPYSALIDAFDELIRQLLTETEDRIDTWRRELVGALTPNGQVLVDVIPDLELLIGAQPAVAHLPPGEAQNRFDMVLVNFLHVLAREDHRLVMFLDDLQWVDSSSLRLIDLLITNPDTQYYLLLGAYRDNEVDSAHPLMLALEGIRASGAAVDTVHLAPLALPDVTRLCADALECPVSRARELAQLVFDKTKGNPFFLRQFLEHLAAQNALAFDFGAGAWQWDIDRIRAMAITDNVVDLMTGRVRELEASTRDALKLAACVGNRFSLRTLAVVNESTPAAVSEGLWPALLAEIILPVGDGRVVTESLGGTAQPDTEYRFLHDRVQEAAYSLIPEGDRRAVHLKIGRALMHETSEEEHESILFDIVNHLNIGADLMADQTERDALARLNLRAGRKAKASTAYADARGFLLTGIGLLAPGSWRDEYDLTLSLYVEAVEIQYLNTDFDAAQDLSEVVVAEARDLLDQVKVRVITVEYLITQNRMVEALDEAFPVLDMLGYPVSEDAVELEHADLFRDVDELDDMPVMTDLKQLAAVQLLSIITGAAYQGKPELMVPVTVRLVDLCLEHGLSSLAAYAYGLYGFLLVGVLQDIERGYRVGELSLRIADHFGAHEYACKTHFIFDTFIRHWKEPHRDSMRTYGDTVQMGLDTGDFVYVAYMRIWSSGYLMLTGHRLDDVEQQQRQYEELMTKLRQENGLYPARIWRQLTINLQGVSDDKHGYYGESFNQEDMRVVEETNVILTLFFAHFARLIQAYVYGDFAAAATHAKRLEPYENVTLCSMLSGGYVYYDALARLAAFPGMEKDERQAAMARVDRHLERLRQWSHHAPMNFRSKVAIVEAEKARMEGRIADAMRGYEQACTMAGEDGFPQEAAVAAERAHDFYAEQGQDRFARIYIREAYDAYSLWGARGKAEDLEEQHGPDLALAIRESGEEVQAAEGSPQPLSGVLDAMTLLKASQALSGEIERGALLTKLMQLAIENAGATRGVLILNSDGDLRAKAVATDGDDDMRILPSVPLEEGSMLSDAMVRLVARTRETIVLGDATEDATFAEDPYIAARKPRSVLCTPVCRHDDVVAMLYLENELTANVFTDERLAVLNVLLAQAAISLDNAALFEKLVRAEESMREEKEFTDAAFDSHQDTFFLFEPGTGKAVRWNRAFREITGYTDEEIAEMVAPSAYYGPEDMERAGVFIREATEAGSGTIELDLICKDGRTVPTEYNVSVLTDDEGRPRYLLSIGRDVTERKRAEEERLGLERQVQHTQKLESLGVLAGGIAHDFNNILLAVLGYADLAIQDLPETHPAMASVREIEKGATRAAELTRQMLAYSGRGRFAIEAVDVSALIDDVAHLLRTSIPRTVALNLHLERSLPAVEADVSQLQQVVMNLITNASEAIGDEAGVMFLSTGEVTCSEEYLAQSLVTPTDPEDAPSPGVYVYFEVRDTGCGMDEDTRSKLFDPFFTTKFTGRGLGMAAVLGIVRGHKGAIMLDTEPGKGTTFRVFFPAVRGRRPHATVATPDDSATPGSTGHGTVLVVDDEDVVRSLASTILQRHGFTLLTAADGREAVEVFREHADEVTCVLLDLTMPHMDGEQTFEALRAIRQDVPVILSSGYDEQVATQRFSDKGLAGFIQKPYQMAKLMAKVREVLGD
ncbi:MAG: AAA family ATPase [bacterium]|nr:AAA family ATPase [bacterium]